MTNLRRVIGVVAVALIVYAWIASLAAQTVSDVATNVANQHAIWVTSIVGFLSLLATQFFQIWRLNQETKAAERRRQWDLEDRATARAETKKAIEEQRLETITTAIELARRSEHIVKELSKNTEITKNVGVKADAAYEAANNFNERLEKLRRVLTSKGEQIDHIEEISGDTNTKVTDLSEGK